MVLQSPREDDDELTQLDLDGLDLDPEPTDPEAGGALVEDVGDDVSDDCMPLDDALEQIGYELFDWDATELDLLDDELHAAKIPHEWVTDGFELVVHEDDEARIDELLPKVRFPDELPVMDDSDATDTDVLAHLYDAADRIERDPRSDGVRLLLDTAERMSETPPFGIDPRAWDAMTEAVDDIIDALHADAPVDGIRAAAGELRARLRPIV